MNERNIIKEISFTTMKKKEKKLFESMLLLLDLLQVVIRRITWYVDPSWQLSPHPAARSLPLSGMGERRVKS